MGDFLHGVEVLEVQEGVRPVRTVKSSVIGLVGTAGRGPVNAPTLVAGSRSEGARIFGETGSIPAALDAIFDQIGASVVVVNVLDPARHLSSVADQEEAFAGDPGEIDLGQTDVSAVVVKHATENTIYVAGTDYTLGAAAGTITRLGTGSIAANAAVRVSFSYPNPKPHFVAVAAADQTFDGNDHIQLPHKELVDVVVAGATGNPIYGSDAYTVDTASGLITRIDGGPINAGATVKVSYRYASPDSVTYEDVAGEAAGDGSFTGAHALLGAESALGFAPKILIAPGYSGPRTGTDKSPVAAELEGVAERLKAVAVIDGPSTTDAEAIAYRGHFGSRRVYLVDPKVKVAGGTGWSSARVAGVIARSDNERGFWWSPSNREVLGILGTARPVDFALGDPNARANLLNEREVATVIRQNGYRLWGNRTCSADPKWAFLSVVRTADQIGQSLLRSHLWAVDRNITKTYLEDVVDGVNAYLRELVGLGAILGGRCWVDADLNSPAVLASGKVYFDFDFTPPYPAERVTFRSHLSSEYLKELA
ncbi:MAG: phage tail sheath subtilisin-like domain-containing protein [Acidobacteriota bacterium]|nr:phage tail sheath subtilisin-like domain-containing protein [Acidobacteriota bacterium]